MIKYVFKKPFYKTLIPILDALGSIFFFPLKFLKKLPPNPKNILIVRLDHIGDFICTTPLFKNIKKWFPEAKITALINSISKDLAYRDPCIDKVITFSPFYLARSERSSPFKGLMRVIKDVRNIGFDLGIDPRGDLLSILIMWLGGVRYMTGYGITAGGFFLNHEGKYDKNIHIIDRNLALSKDLGMPIEDKSPSVYFNDKDIDTVEKLIREKWDSLLWGQSPIILHPFAGVKAKEWPRENFQELIDRFKKDGYEILLVGSSGDEGNFKNVLDTRGQLNLPQLAYLIKKTGFFIGLDSGPANIAAALNVPSVIICSGTNTPELWIPNSPNVKFIYKDVECKPCGNKVCPKEKHECMESITVEEVFNEFRKLTQPQPKSQP